MTVQHRNRLHVKKKKKSLPILLPDKIRSAHKPVWSFRSFTNILLTQRKEMKKNQILSQSMFTWYLKISKHSNLTVR